MDVDIAPYTEERLRQQAEAAGKDIRTYISELVEQAAAKPSLDALLAPLRRQFATSGIEDAELIRDITAAQAEYRAEKNKPLP